MKKGITIFSLALLMSVQGYAQRHSCGTHDPEQLESEYPGFMEESRNLLNHLPVQRNKTQNNNSEYVIPVVVHVVHNNGPEKITEDQVRSQFPALFNDYRRVPKSPGYGGNGVDTKIEFSLATKDPQGNPTTGVVYYQSATLTDHSQSTEEVALKSASRWDPTKYLNIYLVKSITTGSIGGVVLGYATFPGATDNTRDGLVIRADCFGNQKYYPQGTYFTLSERWGRTPTHEIGHWLNLFHTFQSGCGNNCGSSGDLCCDTPPTKEANYGSPSKQNTCGNDNPDKIDDARFYMDYVDNNFMNKFSRCQANRMVATLNNPSYSRRVNLWSDSNQFATGTGRYKKPVANFWANTTNTVVNAPVTFIDYSMGVPDDFSWTFSGGTPFTTFTVSGNSPTVQFPNPGWYSVSLTVQNQADTSMITKSNFIYVGEVAQAFPLSETFEGSSFPPIGWVIVNKDTTYEGLAGVSWGRTNLTASGGFANSKRAARMIFNGYSDIGQEDELWSPVMNTSSTASLKLEFSVAYGPYDYQAPNGEVSVQINDTLAVWVSTDAGNSWTRVYYKGGDDLKTANPQSNGVNFYSATEWRRETVDLSAYRNTDKFRIKFQTINAFGQSLCIDDISLFDNLSSAQSLIFSHSDFQILPNPNKGNASVKISLKGNADFQASVFDIQGRLVYQFENQKLASGEHTIPFDMQNLPSGVYFVKANVGDQIITKKMVKE